jgi:hypothetical protein
MQQRLFVGGTLGRIFVLASRPFRLTSRTSTIALAAA